MPLKPLKSISREHDSDRVSVIGEVITSEEERCCFKGVITKRGIKTELKVELPQINAGNIELIFSNARIVESYDANGVQKYIIGYGLIDNIRLYRMHANDDDGDQSRSEPFSIVKVGIYANDGQNAPNTLLEARSDEISAMIKVSSVEFDRLVANFRENMSCRLFLEGLPIYQLEPSLWIMPVGVKHVVDKKTKFEFNPSAKGPDLSERLLRRGIVVEPEEYSVADQGAFVAPQISIPHIRMLANYLEVAGTVLSQKSFLAAFTASFFLVYKIVGYFS
jgi:hypothetical protein